MQPGKKEKAALFLKKSKVRTLQSQMERCNEFVGVTVCNGAIFEKEFDGFRVA